MERASTIKKLSFEDVQSMFSSYFTLKPKHILLSELLQILPDLQNTPSDIRNFYNQAILKKYPNETSIKSSFLNQVLFKTKHDITVFELPVGGSRVDLCKVNGNSIAYEIKTDLDSLTRLHKQINDYKQVFEQVYIICSETRYHTLEKALPETCGIYTYSSLPKKYYRFTKRRNAFEDLNRIDSRKQLSLLLKKELHEQFPQFITQSKLDTINNIIEHKSLVEINAVFKDVIKMRFSSKWHFLEEHHQDIYEIDYQWFYKNNTNPDLVYGS